MRLNRKSLFQQNICFYNHPRKLITLNYPITSPYLHLHLRKLVLAKPLSKDPKTYHQGVKLYICHTDKHTHKHTHIHTHKHTVNSTSHPPHPTRKGQRMWDQQGKLPASTFHCMPSQRSEDKTLLHIGEGKDFQIKHASTHTVGKSGKGHKKVTMTHNAQNIP